MIRPEARSGCGAAARHSATPRPLRRDMPSSAIAMPHRRRRRTVLPAARAGRAATRKIGRQGRGKPGRLVASPSKASATAPRARAGLTSAGPVRCQHAGAEPGEQVRSVRRTTSTSARERRRRRGAGAAESACRRAGGGRSSRTAGTARIGSSSGPASGSRRGPVAGRGQAIWRPSGRHDDERRSAARRSGGQTSAEG
jgi:hypothetical protein